MFASLVIGLILSMVGGYFAERYAGPLAHHEALPTMLKGLNDRHILAQYTLPANHVLLSPNGLTVFVVKSQPGRVSYEDGRWTHRYRGKFFRQLAGMEALGAPHMEAEREQQKLEHWLEQNVPEDDPPVQAAIVFVNPNVQVEADDSPVPAFYGKKVKSWLRGPGSSGNLSEEGYRRLEAAIVDSE
jgi:hypothetical protein